MSKPPAPAPGVTAAIASVVASTPDLDSQVAPDLDSQVAPDIAPAIVQALWDAGYSIVDHATLVNVHAVLGEYRSLRAALQGLLNATR